MKITKTIGWSLFTAIISFSAFAETPCRHSQNTDNSQATKEKTASDYLEFFDQLDGKCQILSNGGKLTSVKNNHPTKNIRYRFTRVFAGKPQAGLAVGVIEPSEKGIKLGCNRVDDHEQVWKIKVAEFVE